MTSIAKDLDGNNYGWMHYELVASGEFQTHINPLGDEDRFWIGSEGRLSSILFKADTEFTFDNWFTPHAADIEALEVAEQSEKAVSVRKNMHLVNYQNFEFEFEVKRQVKLFESTEIEQQLGLTLTESVAAVGYQTYNEIRNTGTTAWSKDSGLLSIWISGMFTPSKNTTVILPYKNELMLNTSYFGSIPEGKLTITDKHVMYKGDGSHRFKLGFPPKNVMPYIGSYDADKGLLTIITYTFDNDKNYVNSVWRQQQNSNAGDAMNSYNDGRLENSDQIEPCYELETSSGAKPLSPNEAIAHEYKTFHFEGCYSALNTIANCLLHIELDTLPNK